MPDLLTLLGSEGRVLEEKIMLAFDNTERIKIITVFLEQRLKKNQVNESPIISSIRLIIKCNGQPRIAQVTDRYFLSQRQFERKFKEFSGLSPKLFSRIARFQYACNQFGNKNQSLTQIAYRCGYYDQSHFIHEFKEFSGFHPKHYFSGNAEATEWKSN
jgi:AraC-like DNA-binding protein